MFIIGIQSPYQFEPLSQKVHRVVTNPKQTWDNFTASFSKSERVVEGSIGKYCRRTLG